MTTKSIALIPAYEPDRRMLGLIAELGKSGMDVVIVDDGSGVDYSGIFEHACESLPGKSGRRPVLLIHEENRGKGAAIKTGLDYIYNFMARPDDEGADGESSVVVVTMDADGQHLPADAVRVSRAAAANPGSLVLGSRCFGPEGTRSDDPDTGRGRNDTDYAAGNQDEIEKVPLRSLLGNTITRGVFRLASGVAVSDTQTGLRAFTADMIPMLLAISGDRYEYEINMLMDVAAVGIEITELPIETVYYDGNSSSHFDTLKDSWRIYKEIGRHMLAGSAKRPSSIPAQKLPARITSDHRDTDLVYSAQATSSQVNNNQAAANQAQTSEPRTLRQMIKFSASSFASFLIDYLMFGLLISFGAGLAAANICARIISATVNFGLNRKLVFSSDKSLLRSALGYAGLAAFILAGNTLVLSAFVGAGVNSMLAKVITEITFFTLSWLVQRYVIFYQVPDTDEDPATSGNKNIEKAPTDAERHFLLSYSVARPKRLKEAYRRSIV